MEIAIITLQVFAGAAMFFGNGLGKLRSAKKTLAWFESVGMGKPAGVWALLTEGGAALLLLIGVFPRIMAGLIAVTMLGAMLFHFKNKDSFKGGWEEAFLYFILMTFIAVVGISPWGLGI